MYYNKEDEGYRTEVFANEVDKAQNLLTESNFGIIGKSERDTKSIGEVGRRYIEEFTELVKDG